MFFCSLLYIGHDKNLQQLLRLGIFLPGDRDAEKLHVVVPVGKLLQIALPGHLVLRKQRRLFDVGCAKNLQPLRQAGDRELEACLSGNSLKIRLQQPNIGFALAHQWSLELLYHSGIGKYLPQKLPFLLVVTAFEQQGRNR